MNQSLHAINNSSISKDDSRTPNDIQLQDTFNFLNLKDSNNEFPVGKDCLAPIILFCYNRYDVLRETCISLLNNYWANLSEVYIFSDGPKSCLAGDTEKVQEVRNFIQNLRGFRSVTVFEKDVNVGLAESIISGINQICEKHDRFIVLEDDILTSPYFIQYMNKSLNKYMEQKNVWCINGMALSPEVLKIPDDYPYNSYFVYRNSSHGWGSWRDRWQNALWDHKIIRKELLSKANILRFNRGGNDIFPMMQDQLNGNIDSWAIRFSYSISRNDGLCLSPRFSYTSHQQSSEGTHVRNYNKAIDNNLDYSLLDVTYPETVWVDPEIARRFARVYNPSVPTLLQENYMADFDNVPNCQGEQVQVSHMASQLTGGAGTAALNIVKSSNSEKYSSEVFIADGIEHPESLKIASAQQINYEHLSWIFQQKNIYPGNTMFSLSGPSLDLEQLVSIEEHSDLIHLHWVVGLLSTEAIAHLSHSSTPVVWTLHDKNPITGGCHCFHGCDKWKADCMNCPQLKNNYDNFPAKVLATKKKYWNFSNITVVCLSKHSKEIVKDSIFRHCRIEIIPNSIQTDIFCPKDKLSSRKKFNIDLNTKVVFVLPSWTSVVKGFAEFSKALEYLTKDHNDYLILFAGRGTSNFNVQSITVRNLGYIDDKEKLAMAYSLADVTVVPSLEETFSNTTAESLSCGTPVVGFKVGGLPDMIQDGVNGYTVDIGDCEALSEAIVRVLDGPDLSANCRKYAEENLTLELQGQRYKALYEDLLSNRPQKTESPNPIPEIFPELASSQVQILTDVLANTNVYSRELGQSQEKERALQTNRWYRFGQLSRKRKLWVIGKVLSKKLGLYFMLRPLARRLKSFVSELRLECHGNFARASKKRKLWAIVKAITKRTGTYAIAKHPARWILRIYRILRRY